MSPGAHLPVDERDGAISPTPGYDVIQIRVIRRKGTAAVQTDRHSFGRRANGPGRSAIAWAVS